MSNSIGLGKNHLVIRVSDSRNDVDIQGSRFLVRKCVTRKKKKVGSKTLKRSKLLLENKKGRLSFRLQRGMLLAYVCQDQRVTNYRVNDVIRSIEFNQIVIVCIYGEIIAIAATVPFPPPFVDVQLIHEIYRCDDLLFLLSVSQQDNH